MAPVFRRRHEGLTPEEREARIAELRAKRRARLRWLAIRSGILIGLTTVAVVVLAWWLLTTVRGRVFRNRAARSLMSSALASSWRATTSAA